MPNHHFLLFSLVSQFPIGLFSIDQTTPNLGMANPIQMLLIFFTFLLTPKFPLIVSTRTTTTISKYQLECTMCTECDNPCPLPSPPPPELIWPPPPPPPSLPPPVDPQCPPPPSDCYECQLPPPPCRTCPQPYPPNQPRMPPPGAGVIGGAYYPPNGAVPYVPYYDNNRPPYTDKSNSIHLKLQPTVSAILLFLTFLCFF